MTKGPHVETKQKSDFVERLFGDKHYETHICKDGRGTERVTGYGSTPQKSREAALDKWTARQAASAPSKRRS